VICGVIDVDNTCNAFGGGSFRVGYTFDDSFEVYDSTFDSNSAGKNGGGIYIQGLDVTLASSTVSNNVATYAGGIFFYGVMLNSLNQDMTIYGNNAGVGLAGGFAASFSGTFNQWTIASNYDLFAATTGADSTTTVSNSIWYNNTNSNLYNNVHCNAEFADGGGNYEYPITIPSTGYTDSPLCTPNIDTSTDPDLGPLQDNGCTSFTAEPTSGINAGASCTNRQTGRGVFAFYADDGTAVPKGPYSMFFTQRGFLFPSPFPHKGVQTD